MLPSSRKKDRLKGMEQLNASLQELVRFGLKTGLYKVIVYKEGE